MLDKILEILIALTITLVFGIGSLVFLIILTIISFRLVDYLLKAMGLL